MHLHLHSARARYVSRGYSADQRRRESRRQAAQAKAAAQQHQLQQQQELPTVQSPTAYDILNHFVHRFEMLPSQMLHDPK